MQVYKGPLPVVRSLKGQVSNSLTIASDKGARMCTRANYGRVFQRVSGAVCFLACLSTGSLPRIISELALHRMSGKRVFDAPLKPKSPQIESFRDSVEPDEEAGRNHNRKPENRPGDAFGSGACFLRASSACLGYSKCSHCRMPLLLHDMSQLARKPSLNPLNPEP